MRRRVDLLGYGSAAGCAAGLRPAVLPSNKVGAQPNSYFITDGRASTAAHPAASRSGDAPPIDQSTMQTGRPHDQNKQLGPRSNAKGPLTMSGPNDAHEAGLRCAGVLNYLL